MSKTAPNKAPAANFNERLNVAMKLHVAGQHEAALQKYQQLMDEAPTNPDLLSSIGGLLVQLQQPKEALKFLTLATVVQPGNPRFWNNLMIIQRKLGLINDALESYRQLIAIEPNNAKLFTDFFNLCIEQNRPEVAIEVLQKLLTSRPDDQMLHGLLAILYNQTYQKEHLLPHLEAIFKSNKEPDRQLYMSYCIALRNAQRFDDAIKLIEDALVKFPGNKPEFYSIRASIHHMQRKNEEAKQDYLLGLETETSDLTRAKIGFIEMLTSDLKEGHENYAYRYTMNKRREKLDFEQPEWAGQLLAGKSLLVWAEQGVGDVAMFSSFLPYLEQQGAKLTIAMYRKMADIYARSFPNALVVPIEDIEQYKRLLQFDYHVSMGELTRLLLDKYTPSEHPPFLKTDPAKVKQIRDSYLEIAKKRGAKKLIGMSWFTKNKDSYFVRTVPLEQWKPLFEIPGIQWVSLQYGDHDRELEKLYEAMPGVLLVDGGIDGFANLDALAHQAMAMDEVISIQNATVHMAGALGVPTTIMLSYAADWRWGLDRLDNAWYKSVRIERQEELFNWKPVIERIRKRLISA